MRFAGTFLALALLTASASANYGMTPAFFMFSPWTVLIYIVAVIVTESWIIGRNIDQSWGRIILTCIAANFFTGVIGFVFGIPTLSFVLVGSTLDPNPILSAVLAVTLYAAISAPIESLAWMTIRKDMPKPKVFLNTLLAHAIGVPLALLIFLFPSRPYEGMEIYVSHTRHNRRSAILKEFSRTLELGARFPRGVSSKEFFEYLVRHPKSNLKAVPSYAVAILPEGANRFDTSLRRGESFEYNQQVAGKTLKQLQDPKWILRRKSPDPYGYIYNSARGGIVLTHNPAELGY